MSGPNNSNPPFSIRIFLPDGTPDGIRIVEKPNWTGIGVVVPRSLLPAAKKREEFERTGIYILVGEEEDSEQPVIYIGQGDPVRSRLEQHFLKKEFWNQAIFFVTRDDSLNKAHIGYIESELYKLAAQLRRAKLDNQNKPNPSPLAEADTADMNRFLNEILDILPIIGLRVFERPKSTASNNELLSLESKGVRASGYESAQGFVVVEGSTASTSETPSIPAFVSKLRADLKHQGVLTGNGDSLRFAQEYEFNSPSTAAAVVVGASSNGRQMWKDSTGATLNEIQDRLVESSE